MSHIGFRIQRRAFLGMLPPGYVEESGIDVCQRETVRLSEFPPVAVLEVEIEAEQVNHCGRVGGGQPVPVFAPGAVRNKNLLGGSVFEFHQNGVLRRFFEEDACGVVFNRDVDPAFAVPCIELQ